MHARRPIPRSPRNGFRRHAVLDPVHKRQQHIMCARVDGVRPPVLPKARCARPAGAVRHPRHHEQAVERVKRCRRERACDELVHALGVARGDELRGAVSTCALLSIVRGGGTCRVDAAVVGDELAAAVAESGEVAVEGRDPARVDSAHQASVLRPVPVKIELARVEHGVSEPVLREESGTRNSEADQIPHARL